MIPQINTYQEILNTYTKNATLLSPEKEFHFFLRAHKASGDSRYLEILSRGIKKNKLPRLEKDLFNIANPLFISEIPTDSKKGPGINKERNRRRKLLYTKYPLLSPFHDLTNTLFFFKKLSLDTIYPDLFRAGIDSLKKNTGITSVLMSEEGILIDSSYGANTLFHLRFLGIADSTQDYLILTKKAFTEGFYTNPKVLSDEDLYSAFYTLTHIVIAASDFYRQTPHEDFSWIFEYFEKHCSLALEKLSLDILFEIALCYRIMNFQERFFTSYQQYLSYAETNFVLDAEAPLEYLEKKEHTASIALLLFSPLASFFPDPDLSKITL
jgi:hypothetical protein